MGKSPEHVERITQRNGFHSINFSATSESYIDSFSNTETPKQVSLHLANGDRSTDFLCVLPAVCGDPGGHPTGNQQLALAGICLGLHDHNRLCWRAARLPTIVMRLNSNRRRKHGSYRGDFQKVRARI